MILKNEPQGLNRQSPEVLDLRRTLPSLRDYPSGSHDQNSKKEKKGPGEFLPRPFSGPP